MTDTILKLLRDMTQINAPSGCEEAIREYIAAEAEKYADSVTEDAMGNVIARKKGGGKKIMFAAHMDEIGIIVTDIDENGFIYFAPVGGLNLRSLPEKRVRFPGGAEGVIGAMEKKFEDKPSYDKLFIDVGAVNRSGVSEYNINIGDMAVFVGGFATAGGTVISKALDNRAGCAALLQAMSMLKKTENDLYFVFTSQEEVGLRGARTAAFNIEPDIAVSVDVTDTGDVPDAPKMAVRMGKGAAVKVMDRSVICDAYTRRRIADIADKADIPYQLEIMTDGGTDAGAIYLTRGGIRTGGISIPVRYIHSPCEIASISDICSCARLVCEAAAAEW